MQVMQIHSLWNSRDFYLYPLHKCDEVWGVSHFYSPSFFFFFCGFTTFLDLRQSKCNAIIGKEPKNSAQPSPLWMQVWTNARYTKETHSRTAREEKKRMRLNRGSGYWSVVCAEEETPGWFGGWWCHPSQSAGWGRPREPGHSRGQRGKPNVTWWLDGSGFRDLCHTRTPGEAVFKANDSVQKKCAWRRPDAKGWCNVCPQVQSSDKHFKGRPFNLNGTLWTHAAAICYLLLDIRNKRAQIDAFL